LKGKEKMNSIDDQPANPPSDPIHIRTPEECEQIYQAIKNSNARALQRLREKCQWEGMGLLAVIREFGDPRKWPK
jgi:hypothetical protein